MMKENNIVENEKDVQDIAVQEAEKICEALSAMKNVVKSRTLLNGLHTPLSVNGYRMLDTYISRLDINNPEKTAVMFSKRDFENIFGIKRIRKELLVKTVHQLFDVCLIYDKQEYINDYEITDYRIRLFSEVATLRDRKGNYYIRMKCSDTAKKLLFDVKKHGYVKYKLSVMASLSTENAIRLYLYIANNAFKWKWSVDLDTLKRELCCDSIATYNEFKDFNKFILKKAAAEINAKTDIIFTYTSLKKGNKVNKIEFSIVKEGNMVNQDVLTEEPVVTFNRDEIEVKMIELTEGKLSDAEIRSIRNELDLIEEEWLQEYTKKKIPSEAKLVYLKLKYSDACVRANANLYGYLLASIQADKKQKTEQKSKASYDIDELEKITILDE